MRRISVRVMAPDHAVGVQPAVALKGAHRQIGERAEGPIHPAGLVPPQVEEALQLPDVGAAGSLAEKPGAGQQRIQRQAASPEQVGSVVPTCWAARSAS